MMSEAVSNDAAAPTIVSDVELKPPLSAATESSGSPAIAEPLKPSSAPITGLKPDQILQELKKSGYVDQLRRQMFDAFTAVQSRPASIANAPASSSIPPVVSANESAPAGSEPSSSADHTTTQGSASQPEPSDTPGTAQAKAVEAGGATTTAQTALDIGSKSSFLSFLSAPLRHQVEEEHDNLRLLDSRGQQDKLLKLLESDPVDYPNRASLGDATLYDLLVRHIVSAGLTAVGTSGMLSKDGKIGKDANARIGDTIADLLNPASKDAEEEEGEEEEEDEDEESSKVAAQAQEGKMRTD